MPEKWNSGQERKVNTMTPKFMNNLGDKAGIADGIKWVRSTGSKFDEYVHAIAIAIMRRAKEHGDCSQALDLYFALPKSNRRAALVNWFGHFSPIRLTINKDAAKCKVGLRKVGDKAYMPFNIEGATANPYFEWEKDKELEALMTAGDLNDMLIKLVKRVQDKVKNGKVAANDVAAIETKLAEVAKVTTVAA